MSLSTRKKLNEKELGSLYLVSETPLIADRILNASPEKTDYKDQDIQALHLSLGAHAPDMALIAISLSGNMIAEAMKDTGLPHLKPLATELKYLSVNTVEEVGRIWIDACRYGIHNQADIDDMVHQSADILCMFASIFMEIAEAATPQPETIRALTAAMMYQCEAQADSARSLIDNAIDTASNHGDSHAGASRSSLDSIPLPEELQNKHYTDNVVTFTLFGEQRR